MKPQSNFWVDQAAAAAMAAYPEGEIIVSSGHSPSGNYHVGTVREILTASAVAWAIRNAGRRARHIDFVDDFDAFRKVPVNVPEEWTKYIGWPLYAVPDPWDCHLSYGAHFVADLYSAIAVLGVEVETVYAHEAYPAGKFTASIKASLAKLEQVRIIVAEVSGRELPDEWAPVQILSDAGSLREWRYSGWDKERGVVTYTTREGESGEVSYSSGRVKLDWRLDWPARWAIWNVNVEPFGRDHATKGGSYDTGKKLVADIFGGAAPLPVPYDFVNRFGNTKKMSKSSGDVITASGALEIMPPEILRFFILRTLPGRTLVFDEGVGLYNLIDEYSKVEQAVKAGQSPDFAEAYQLASAQTQSQTISSVPFNHLVAVYQAARRSTDECLAILARTGFETAVNDEREVIERELVFVGNWLDRYAPESVVFSVQTTLPDVDLSEGQKQFLSALADTISGAGQPMDGQVMHEAIYAARETAQLKPADAFKTLYWVILGKDSGPKAGWFLASLETGWLVDRLNLTK